METFDWVRYVKVTREHFGYGKARKGKRKRAFSAGVNNPLCGWRHIEGRLHPKLTAEGKQVMLRDARGNVTRLPGTRRALREQMRDTGQQRMF